MKSVSTMIPINRNDFFVVFGQVGKLFPSLPIHVAIPKWIYASAKASRCDGIHNQIILNPDWLQAGQIMVKNNHLKMYFPLNMMIFQPVMPVFRGFPSKLKSEMSFHRFGGSILTYTDSQAGHNDTCHCYCRWFFHAKKNIPSMSRSPQCPRINGIRLA